MTKPEIKEEEKSLSENKKEVHKAEPDEKKDSPAKEETTEDKLKAVEEKLLRAMAQTENQRKRFERERQEAFDFGGFNFARESLSLLDNIDRAIKKGAGNDPDSNYDEVRYAKKSCKKLKLEDLGYSCFDLESQTISRIDTIDN